VKERDLNPFGYESQVPEFPDSLIMAMFMLTALLTIAAYKEKQLARVAFDSFYFKV
jgi:hypothetical protein